MLKEKYKCLLMLDLNKKELRDFYPDDKIIKIYGGIIMSSNRKADFIRSISEERDRQMILRSEKRESYKEGKAAGMNQGRLEGERKGRLEGERKGRLEGALEEKQNIAKILLARNESRANVCAITGLSPSMVKNLM